MAVGWNGATPVEQADPGHYELGTAQKANVDITITAIRVWSGNSPLDLAGRTATLWTTGGGQTQRINLPTTLSPGWTQFDLTSQVAKPAGSQWVVSFSSGGNYGYVDHALDTDQSSADSAVTTLGYLNAPGQINGRFTTVPGDFPATGTAGHGFYGIDVVYTLGIGGNTPPVVTAVDLVDVAGTVTATAHVTDAETLVGSTIKFDWGDGSAVSAVNWPTVTATHTYAVSGLYPVLVSCTDADGASGYRAGAIQVTIPPNAPSAGFDIVSILDAITSHAAQLGPFERIVTHEPKAAVASGLTGAVWVNQLDPVPEYSGLAESAIRIQFVLRLYDNMMREPQDLIDPQMTQVVNDLLVAYHGNFTLGGVITEIDLLGQYGQGLNVRSGYIKQDNKLMRVMSLYLPVIVASAFTQEA